MLVTRVLAVPYKAPGAERRAVTGGTPPPGQGLRCMSGGHGGQERDHHPHRQALGAGGAGPLLRGHHRFRGGRCRRGLATARAAALARARRAASLRAATTAAVMVSWAATSRPTAPTTWSTAAIRFREAGSPA